MNNIFLTIIMPMYNVKNYIKKSLESLNNQKCKDFEVILIDDGSLDNSYEVAKNYLSSTDLNYNIIKEENLGQSFARNKGLELAKGQYILFLDSDDFINEKLVEKTKEITKEINPDILLFDYKRVRENGEIINNKKLSFDYLKKINNGIEIFYSYKNNEFRLWTSSLIYKKEFIKNNNIKYLVGAYGAEDLNFIFKSLIKAKNIFAIEDVISYYFQRKDSLTNNPDITKNITVIDSMEDVCNFILDNSLDSKLEDIIKREFIPEHIMYQIFGSINKNNKNQIKKVLKNSKVKKYLKGCKYNTTRYGRSMFIWTKFAYYFPSKFIDTYLKRK